MAAQASSDQGGLAQRYAAALFELADGKQQLDPVAGDLASLDRMIGDSADLRRLINSPILSRTDQAKGIQAVGAAAGLSALSTRFLGIVSQNRRLFVLPAIIRAYRAMLAARRGEISAEVWSARPLSPDQEQALSEAIRRAHGSKVTIAKKVDPALLGGLVIKVGSRMIDSSIKTKLTKLQLAMKGVG